MEQSFRASDDISALTVTEFTGKLRTESTVPDGFTLIIKGYSSSDDTCVVACKVFDYSLAEIDDAIESAELSLVAHEALDSSTADVISDQQTFQTWQVTLI